MYLNWAQKEMNLKLVYCGPPLSGKTTNLEKIHELLPENRRTDLVSVKTRQDRTLYFDFIENGAARGAPQYMEWYAAFGLIVTLVWLYNEILRLLSKLRSRQTFELPNRLMELPC